MRHVRASFAFAGSLACPIAPRRTFKALMPDVTIDPARGTTRGLRSDRRRCRLLREG
jgi:hypothetical protein